MSSEEKVLIGFTDEENNRWWLMSDLSAWGHVEGMNEPFQVKDIKSALWREFIARLALALEAAEEAIREVAPMVCAECNGQGWYTAQVADGECTPCARPSLV